MSDTHKLKDSDILNSNKVPRRKIGRHMDSLSGRRIYEDVKGRVWVEKAKPAIIADEQIGQKKVKGDEWEQW